MKDNDFNTRFWATLKGVMWGLFACLVITLIFGCTTTKYVPVEQTHTEYVTRTVRDTVVQERIVERAMSTAVVQTSRVRDSVATVVDELGNVKRTDAWHWSDTQHDTQTEKVLRDSLTALRTRCDSLTASVNDTKKEIMVEKREAWFVRTAKTLLEAVGLAALLGFGIYCVLKS